MICQYALNKENKMVFIDDVEKGKSCKCHCLSCNEELVAKNGGSIKIHHFAHESGTTCAGYKETLLHIWSKEIIEQFKILSIPKYKSTDNGVLLINPYDEKDFSLSKQKVQFNEVEIEKRLDISELQPDIVGITNDGLRLWIEISVTHKCPEDKISKIKENGINCIEIQIPENIETKDRLTEFLINSYDSDNKYFINYPYGEKQILKNKKEYFNELKSKCKIIKLEDCNKCFKNIKLQEDYSDLLNKYKNVIQNNNSYILKFKSLKDLINRYPKLRLLSEALKRERLKHNSSISKLNEESFNTLMEFANQLSELMKNYEYDSTFSFYWNCENIFATSKKDEKTCVFCTKK